MGNTEYKRKGESTPAPLSAFEQAQINELYRNSVRNAIHGIMVLGVYITIMVFIIRIYKIERARAIHEGVCIEAGANIND